LSGVEEWASERRLPRGRKRPAGTGQDDNMHAGASLMPSQIPDVEVCISPVNALSVSGSFKVLKATT
jgi:hypothetical protein